MHAAGSAGTKSGNEVAFLSMLSKLPDPLVNTKLHGVELDFHWPDRKLAIEVDGPGHARARTRKDDAFKQAILTAAGYTVVRLTEEELTPELIARRVSRPARP